jgi:hypothetical protein
MMFFIVVRIIISTHIENNIIIVVDKILSLLIGLSYEDKC